MRQLEPATVPSTLDLARYMENGVRVLVDPHVPGDGDNVAGDPQWHEQAGPRRLLWRDPTSLRCGILTAGGICPGLNDVIRALVLELHHVQGVQDILGIRHGYEGLSTAFKHTAVKLSPEDVDGIHLKGGTVLGTSRGSAPTTELCDNLEDLGLDVLFCIGGDGTLKGAAAIDAELERRGKLCAVVGIPKTIDNDIEYSSRSFGFQTAVAAAARSVTNSHAEARGHRNGIGLVKVMGRESGFIAASAALAAPETNFVLIPEVPFELDGDQGFLRCLEKRLEARGHAVIVVAEGAAVHLPITGEESEDASGNLKRADVGPPLVAAIKAHFASLGTSIQLKYFDPSYDIRSVPAVASDAILCGQLAKMAVHAALAGKTGLMIGVRHDMFVHVPLADVILARKRVKPEGLLWQSVLATTGQSSLIRS